MPESLRNAYAALKIPDLRRKLLFTFGILIIFRFVAHVPVPGVDVGALRDIFAENQLLGMLDLFSGGAMRNLSIAAMGVYPYITATIVIQLMQPVIPALGNLAKEGEAGRNRINQITHWITVPMAALQAIGQLAVLQGSGIISGVGLGPDSLLPTVAMIVAMTAGTMLSVWLGELITENGIGNGISVIIFGGIVAAALPGLVQGTFAAQQNMNGIIAFTVLGIATVVAIVIFQEASRRIPVQSARSTFRGGRMYRQAGTSFIPLRVNSAGMIPLIFAMSIMIFPGTIASFFTISSNATVAGIAGAVNSLFDANGFTYWGFYFVLVVGFTFFYALIMFRQQNLADNLKNSGGFVPGIRPGRPTEEYLTRVLIRITWAGAVYLGIVAIMPFFAQLITNIRALALPAIGLLIVVGVVLDTMKQLEAQLLMRRYEGFIR